MILLFIIYSMTWNWFLWLHWYPASWQPKQSVGCFIIHPNPVTWEDTQIVVRSSWRIITDSTFRRAWGGLLDGLLWWSVNFLMNLKISWDWWMVMISLVNYRFMNANMRSISRSMVILPMGYYSIAPCCRCLVPNAPTLWPSQRSMTILPPTVGSVGGEICVTSHKGITTVVESVAWIGGNSIWWSQRYERRNLFGYFSEWLGQLGALQHTPTYFNMSKSYMIVMSRMYINTNRYSSHHPWVLSTHDNLPGLLQVPVLFTVGSHL